MSTFVCSDIHGNYDAWLKALKKSGINFDAGDKLIILGDLIDRGDKSYDCLSYTFDLIDKYPEQVIYLMGNHEEMFLDFLTVNNPESSHGYEKLMKYGRRWLENGGLQMVTSFLGDTTEYYVDDLLNLYNIFHEKYGFVNKLNDLPYYFIDENHNIVCVHAGFKSGIRLKEQKSTHMLWIRDEFYKSFEPVKSDQLDGKLIVHGHTPVKYFKNYGGEGFYQGKHHIGIDGGAAMDRKILIVKIDDLSYVEQAI